MKILSCNDYLGKCKEKLDIKCLSRVLSNKMRMNITKGLTLKGKEKRIA